MYLNLLNTNNTFIWNIVWLIIYFIFVVIIIIIIVLLVRWMYKDEKIMASFRSLINSIFNSGSKQPIRNCPNCGRPIPMDAKVCPYCIKKFDEYV